MVTSVWSIRLFRSPSPKLQRVRIKDRWSANKTKVVLEVIHISASQSTLHNLTIIREGIHLGDRMCACLRAFCLFVGLFLRKNRVSLPIKQCILYLRMCHTACWTLPLETLVLTSIFSSLTDVHSILEPARCRRSNMLSSTPQAAVILREVPSPLSD